MLKKLLFFSLLLLGSLSPLYAQETFTLSGKVIQGTADGAALPETLPLTLRILTPEGAELSSFTGTSATDGSFIFENLPRYDDHFYIVSTPWAGIEQSTIPIKPPELQGILEFPLYELTTSLANVVGNRGNLRVEFSEVNDIGLQMLLELGYSNLGDRIIWTNPNTAVAQSFIIELPVGALGIAPEQAPGAIQRYEAINAINSLPIPGVRDTQPLVPNWPNLMRVSFFVPYQDGAVVDIRFPFAVSDIGVFVRENTVSLESDLLTISAETQTSSGRVYNIYEQTRPLNPNEPFKFTLLGIPREATRPPAETTSASTPLLIIIITVVVLFVGLLVWLSLARQARKKPR